MQDVTDAARAAEALTLRRARLEDGGAISALIDASVRVLQAGDYTPAQRELALGQVFGLDRQLIRDGSYFVVEEGGALVACGGWSWRRTLFGADGLHSRDDAPLQPGVEAAKIRAFFVAPAWARRGLASRLLAVCEAEAAARGFTTLELGATLTGEPFYARNGYQVLERLEAPLTDAIGLPIVRMGKTLGRDGEAAAS